jgi:hypothetical protein
MEQPQRLTLVSRIKVSKGGSARQSVQRTSSMSIVKMPLNLLGSLVMD